MISSRKKSLTIRLSLTPVSIPIPPMTCTDVGSNSSHITVRLLQVSNASRRAQSSGRDTNAACTQVGLHVPKLTTRVSTSSATSSTSSRSFSVERSLSAIEHPSVSGVVTTSSESLTISA